MTARVEPKRAALSLLVFVGWILITAFLPRLWEPVHLNEALDTAVSKQISPGIAAAIVYLFMVIALFRWDDIGLNRPRSLSSLGLLWFPAIYICLFVALIVFRGTPPAGTILIIFLNTMMVGLSEEVACRGILYQGLRSRFAPWTAILVSTALFGIVHVFNGFNTGDFRAASIQAVTAFMTGIAFMGIRIRTGSLLPGIILHSAWDFTLVMSTIGSVLPHGPPASTGTYGGWFLFIPVLVILPNFLYGLFLLRHADLHERPIAHQAHPPAPPRQAQ
jgi:membrane protease YdiL (CAAX protease family)